MRPSRQTLLTTLLICGLPASLSAQTLLGIVRMETEAGRTVPAAEIVVVQDDIVRRVVSNEKGTFRVPLRPGRFRVEARALGFETIESGWLEAEASQRISLNIILDPDPLVVAPVIVTARQLMKGGHEGFAFRMERGRKSGMGQFLGEAELARSIYVSDAIRRLPFMHAVLSGRGSRGPTTLYGTPIGVRPFGHSCTGGVAYYVDGVPIRMEADQIDGLISLQDVMGIEVYRRPHEVPGEFGGGSNGCGAVAIWTKR